MVIQSQLKITLIGIVFTALAVWAGPRKEIPVHPSKLTYDSLRWTVPLGDPYRKVLPNGLRTYVAEDRSLPFVDIVIQIRGGSLFDPPGKEGLAALTSGLMRTAGTKRFAADTLDAIAERLAIRAWFEFEEAMIEFHVQCLSEKLDSALIIMEEVLLRPVFDQEKFNKERQILIEKIRHRFDNPEPILGAAYTKTMYPGQPNSRLSSEKSVKSITRTDLIDFHKKVFLTENMVLGAAGDFSADTLRARLSAMFPKASGTMLPPASSAMPNPAARCMIVARDATQSWVRMGLPLFQRPHPDYYAVSVLNLILGDDGFTSRLGSRIRSDEGLTYSIHSAAGSNYSYPSTMFITFHTKTESTSRAIAVALEEIGKVVTDGVTEQELQDARNVLIDEFPSMFRSPADITATYAWNEYYGRSPDHFAKYPAEIRAISRDDVLRVARKYLTTDSLTYVIVGDTAGIFAADTLGGFSLRKLLPRKITVADSIAALP